MYLRIAPEISLKMATVGGLERVFEIGKDFRNEGSSPAHHQEFTVAEHYAAYRNYEDNMRFTEQMFDYFFDHIPQLSKKVMIADKEWVKREVDFSTPRRRIDYIDQIQQDSWIDVWQYGPSDEDALRELIKSKGFDRVGIDKQWTATMIDYLYKKVTRPKIIGPAFIYNYPKTMQPLARSADTNHDIAEQFQCIVNGREILKAYSELVDPLEQQSNFDEQAWAVAKGDDEATKGDDEFVKAMEYGMPCQSGRWMGLERIFAMLTQQSNIRDVIMFPMMKPEHNNEWWMTTDNKKEEKKSDTPEKKSSLEMNKRPYLIQVLGLVWWGKSTATNYIAQTLSIPCVQVDLIQKSLFSDPQYTPDEDKVVNAVFEKEILTCIAKKQSCVVEWYTTRQERRDIIKQLCDEYGYQYIPVCIETDEEHFKARIEQRFAQEGRDSDGDWNVHLKHKARRSSVQDDVTVIENNGTMQQLFEKLDCFLGWIGQKSSPQTPSTPPQSQASSNASVPSFSDEIVAQVESLARKYLTETYDHCAQVGRTMREFAKDLWQDENYWYTVWLLHDVDRDHISKSSQKHLQWEFVEIVNELAIPDGEKAQLIHDIRTHYPDGTGVDPETLVQQYLISIDELSWLIHAYSLMRPEWLDGIKRSSLSKKIKDKGFAAGVDREHVKNSEKYLGIALEDFAMQVVEKMRG